MWCLENKKDDPVNTLQRDIIYVQNDLSITLKLKDNLQFLSRCDTGILGRTSNGHILRERAYRRQEKSNETDKCCSHFRKQLYLEVEGERKTVGRRSSKGASRLYIAGRSLHRNTTPSMRCDMMQVCRYVPTTHDHDANVTRDAPLLRTTGRLSSVVLLNFFSRTTRRDS
jgi:hypothetical protein